MEASFDAEPSTPSPTGTPASSSSSTLAVPEARRMLEVGQCATAVPAAPSAAISPSVKWMPWPSHVRPASQPTLSR